MWSNFKAFLQRLVANRTVRTVLLVALTAFVPWLMVPALMVGAAQWLQDRHAESRRAVDPSYQSPAERRAERRRRRAAVREAAAEYSRANGIDVSKLPAGLVPDFSTKEVLDGGGFSVMMDAAGIRHLVEARAKGRDIEYSFRVPDGFPGEELEREVRMHGGVASLGEDSMGRRVVKAATAASIAKLAEKVYPRQKVDVRCVTEHVSQWRVDGCRSYEEAVEKLRSMKEADPSLSPLHSFVRTSEDVGGEKRSWSSGEPLGAAELDRMGLGSFIVTETESFIREGRVEVPAGAVGPEAVRDAALDKVFSPEGGFEPRREEGLSDGTPEGTVRYVHDAAEDRWVAVSRAEGFDPSREGLRAYVVCSDIDSLAEVLREPELPSGTFVTVQAGEPVPPPGGYVVALDVDSDLFASLRMQGDGSASVLKEMEAWGLGGADAKVTGLKDALGRDGCATLVLESAASLGDARVNGVPASELAERINSTRLPALSRPEVAMWLEDAARIQAVSVEVDARRGVLKVNSVVGNTLRKEERKLTDGEMRDLARRGTVPMAEMKDLLMAVYPSLFKTYTAGGRSLFRDPLADYIAGRAPVAEASVKKAMREERKASKGPRRKTGGPSL